MTSQQINSVKEQLNSLSSSDLSTVIREALSILIIKLHEEDGFPKEAAITGRVDDYWPKVIIVNDSEPICSNSIKDRKIFMI